MMKILKLAGYHNLIGFDFAPNMIAKGLQENLMIYLEKLKDEEKNNLGV